MKHEVAEELAARRHELAEYRERARHADERDEADYAALLRAHCVDLEVEIAALER